MFSLTLEVLCSGETWLHFYVRDCVYIIWSWNNTYIVLGFLKILLLQYQPFVKGWKKKTEIIVNNLLHRQQYVHHWTFWFYSKVFYGFPPSILRRLLWNLNLLTANKPLWGVLCDISFNLKSSLIWKIFTLV